MIMQDDARKEKSGLTFRSMLAIAFAATILMPVTIWMQLVGGQAAGLGFTTILLFIFITKYFGRSPLTSQEIILINIGIGIAAYIPFFATFINRAYFAGAQRLTCSESQSLFLLGGCRRTRLSAVR